jgi:hypothetical protein
MLLYFLLFEIAILYLGTTTRSVNGDVTSFTNYWETSLILNKNTNCNSVCTSSTGQFVYAGCRSYGIFCSQDWGGSWVLCLNATDVAVQDPSGIPWTGCSTSSDGKFVYVVNGGEENSVFYSSNSGSSWKAAINVHLPEGSGIATDSTGQYVYVSSMDGVTAGFLYYSNNSGISWMNFFASAAEDDGYETDAITSITLCQDGSYGFYTTYDGKVFQIVDANTNKPARYDQIYVPTDPFLSVATSSDGKYTYASTADTTIYFSDNFGNAFNPLVNLYPYLTSIACTESGSTVFIASSKGNIYISTNFGAAKTWFNSSSQEGYTWYAITTNQDGQYTYAAGMTSNEEGVIYFMNSSATVNTGTPSSQPTSSPSTRPTVQPSAIPSGRPTSSPSAVPTLNAQFIAISPTLAASSTEISYSFTQLNTNGAIYLTAEVELSYLDVASGGYIVINTGNKSVVSDASSAVGLVTSATTQLISSNCAPVESCTSTSTVTCVSNLLIQPEAIESGGVLSLVASVDTSQIVSGSAYKPCDYGGADVKFVLTYTVSSYLLPTPVPTPAPTPSGGSKTNSNLLKSKSAPFYTIAIVVVIFTIAAVAIVRLRDKQSDSAKLGLLKTCASMALLGYHLISEILYVIFLAEIPPSRGLRYLFIIIVIARVLSVVPFAYFILLVFGPETWSTNYLQKMNVLDLNRSINTYAVVIIFMLVDHTLVVYLPWSPSAYVDQSGGFPDSHMFNTAMWIRMIQSIMSISVQIIVFRCNSGHLVAEEGINEATVSLLYFIASVLVFSVTALTVAIRIRITASTISSSSSTAVNAGPRSPADNRDSATNPMRAMSIEDNWVGNPVSNSTELKGVELNPRPSASQ